jgi:hypothetical protein
MIRFESLPTRPPEWDRIIAQFETKTLFHESAWLDHVQSIHPSGKLVYFRIVQDGKIIGYHCGLRIAKALLRIQGSPLGGTGTNFMGPLVQNDVDQRELVRALTALAGPRNFLHIELSNPSLNADVMREAGFGVHETVTHVVPIPGTKEEAWAAMRGPARNRVRKAQGNGLIVERTDNPAIVDHFFEQFIEVYGKQGMVTPWGRERPLSLFQNLMPAGRLLPLWVRHGDEIVAAGLFPYDERAIYFWGAGSWLKHHALCPNEALQWGVIEFAVEKGIPFYNMCGGKSQFKDKFGGSDVPYRTYYRSFIPGLAVARKWYRAWHFRRLRTGASQIAQSS